MALCSAAQTSTAPLTEEQLESTIVNYLQKVFADDAKNTFLAISKVTLDSSFPATGVEIIRHYPNVAARRIRVDYRLNGVNGWSSTRSMWFTLQKIKNIYIAADTIHKHQPLIQNMVSVQSVDVLAQLCQPLSEVPVPSVRARRVIPAGEVVCQEAFESVPVVEMNQRVELFIRRRGFYINTEATALVQGGKGDLIKVRVKHSGMIVSARITEEGLVRYESHE